MPFSLHLWNERLPVITPGGADLAWARRILRRFIHSLHLLSVYLQENPQFNQIRTFGGITILLTSGLHGRQPSCQIWLYGHASNQRLGHFGEFWENFYTRVLIWTYKKVNLPTYSFSRMQHAEMWIQL